ncbi:MAG: DUF4189 domain-containing protein [Deltaproteobacteria bacterium]|nr:DUF4189 domain-containing protein [Deltaproteobacteria bacterium]
MGSYDSISLWKHTSRTILIIICTAWTIAQYSTTATAYLFYSGDGTAHRKIEQVYNRCLVDSMRSYSVEEEDRIFSECIDKAVERIGGLSFAVLVMGESSGGNAYNYRNLAAALNGAKRHCDKHDKCSLKAFVINGCIAFGRHDAAGYFGYGVGATKAAARREMLTGSNVHSCGPGCKVGVSFCAEPR